MAFHKNLINALWDYFPAAGPDLRRDVHQTEPRLAISWELGPDGRPQSHWTITPQ